jgi:hypothetical protein
MASIVTHKFKQFNADQFYESLSEAVPSYLYMYIGRIRAWGDDTVPPAPSDAIGNTEFDFWRNMLSAKKVGTADASYCIARKNWTSGVVYNEYDHRDKNLYNHANGHYVMSAAYNVYKCLFNNNGQASTVEPTGASSSILSTADSYKWKFMYTITAAEALKFLTSAYIPVKHIGTTDDGSDQWDIEQAAANGAIDVIDVTAGGSSFNNYNTGTLANVTNSSAMTLSSGASSTSGVYSNSVLYLTGGTGAGQQANIQSYAGASKKVYLDVGFSTTPDTSTTYSIAPMVLVNGDGSLCNAVCTMNATSNTVYSVTVTGIGRNYSQAFVTLTANGLSGATAEAFVPPPGGHGNNAVTELGGYNVMLNSRFDKGESNTFTVLNDYREVGLLRDPKLPSGAAATGTRYDQTLQLTYSGLSGTYVNDEKITGTDTGAFGYLVESNTTVMKISSANGTFSNSETLTGATSSATSTSVTVANGDLLQYSGELMYTEYKSPVTRATDQIEDVKLVINF